MNWTRHNSIAVIGVALALGACAKSDKTATTSDSAMAPAAPTFTDANIVAVLDEANVADSAGGKVAATKGTNAEVKAFGAEMVKDHHNLRVAGQNFAKTQNITPVPPTGDTMQADADAFLKTLNDTPKGAAWDKAYIDHEVAGHEKVLQKVNDFKNATQNAELKALIDKATPTIQQHLDKAKSIQSKLTPAT
jgi:putative membrane protein